MNVPTTATTPAAAVQSPPVNAPAAPAHRTSGEQRAAAIKAQLTEMEESGETEPKESAPAKAKPASKSEKREVTEKPEPKPERQQATEKRYDREESRTESAKESDSGGEDEEAAVKARAAKESADRLARINAVRAKEEAARQENARRKQAKKPATPAIDSSELEQLRKRVAELEPKAKAFSSPLEMLEWAEREGHSPVDVANVLRQKLTDPNAIAQQHARTAEERIRAEVKAEMEELRASHRRLEERLAEERKLAREQAEATERTSAFVSRVSESDSHPRTAKLLRARGEASFINFVNTQVVAHLERGYSVDYLHDVTEQYLEWLQDMGESPAPANGASQHPKSGAAKPVTTLSGALTSGRHAVTEEKPLHLLSKKEREARLKAQLERE